mmetsp:Transcript_26356/g.55038  ORF Transcript_26356/g.55038 Transcript_26356/m.55038 type:complete len:231 (+) Transcript_26356:1271-1963(+)
MNRGTIIPEEGMLVVGRGTETNGIVISIIISSSSSPRTGTVAQMVTVGVVEATELRLPRNLPRINEMPGPHRPITMPVVPRLMRMVEIPVRGMGSHGLLPTMPPEAGAISRHPARGMSERETTEVAAAVIEEEIEAATAMSIRTSAEAVQEGGGSNLLPEAVGAAAAAGEEAATVGAGAVIIENGISFHFNVPPCRIWIENAQMYEELENGSTEGYTIESRAMQFVREWL